jgi:hypothetical protein
MSIADRIEQAPACEVINLSESEKDIYCGSGWKLARFENGVLTGFFNPKDTPYRSDVQAMATEAVNNAAAWLANPVGEVWLVFCSGYQLANRNASRCMMAQDWRRWRVCLPSNSWKSTRQKQRPVVVAGRLFSRPVTAGSAGVHQ